MTNIFSKTSILTICNEYSEVNIQDAHQSKFKTTGHDHTHTLNHWITTNVTSVCSCSDWLMKQEVHTRSTSHRPNQSEAQCMIRAAGIGKTMMDGTRAENSPISIVLFKNKALLVKASHVTHKTIEISLKPCLTKTYQIKISIGKKCDDNTIYHSSFMTRYPHLSLSDHSVQFMNSPGMSLVRVIGSYLIEWKKNSPTWI